MSDRWHLKDHVYSDCFFGLYLLFLFCISHWKDHQHRTYVRTWRAVCYITHHVVNIAVLARTWLAMLTRTGHGMDNLNPQIIIIIKTNSSHSALSIFSCCHAGCHLNFTSSSSPFPGTLSWKALMRGKMAKRQAGYGRRSYSRGMSWGNNWIISSWKSASKALFNSFWLLLGLGSHFCSTSIHWGLLSARFCSGGFERSRAGKQDMVVHSFL